MKPIYAVKADDNIVAIFKRQKDAYKLRAEKTNSLPESCYVRVEKHVLFEDIDDRERLRS